MYKCIFVIIALLLLAGICTNVNATEFSSLEERMSQSEFQAAGLSKLSPDELKALDAWLRTHLATAATPQYVTPSGQPVFYPNQSEREVIDSRINGTFRGWYGHSTFVLENGQEWTQAESGRRLMGPYENPTVKIKPMILGSWLMYIDKCGCSVRVQRSK